MSSYLRQYDTSTVWLLVIKDEDDSYFTTFANELEARHEMVSFLTGMAAPLDDTQPEPDHIEWDGADVGSSNSGWIESLELSAEVKPIAHLS